MSERKGLFVSYSHADEEWLGEIKKWLQPLEAKGLVSIWDDTGIQAGAIWRDEIQKGLDEAKLAMLLVTQDFLNSEFITQNELPPLLEKSRSEGLKVLWVAVRPSTYRDSAIEKYQAVNNPSKPLSSLEPAERDEALLDLYQVVKNAVVEE